MKYSKLEYYSSQQRLDRFLSACGNSKSKAQKLYRINIRVSQAFYPVLNQFEIFLRNTMNYHVSGYFSDPNWIINQKSGFMNDRTLGRSRYYLKRSIQSAENAIRRKGGTVTPGKVIAEQSLGFWTSLFDRHHYRLIGGIVIHCFRNKASYVNRSILSQKLNEVREFRNRVFHNEPICFNDRRIDFSTATSVRQNIYELLTWIDPDLPEYVLYFDSILSKIDSINSL